MFEFYTDEQVKKLQVFIEENFAWMELQNI